MLRLDVPSRRLFINYRSKDCAETASALFRDLEAKLGKSYVFIDHAGITGGDEWPESLAGELEKATAMLCLIGSAWLDEGLNDTDDWVRREIEHALARGIQIIPVLINGADVPKSADLPETLRRLANKQARPLRRETWREDLDRILADLGLPRRRTKGPLSTLAAGALTGALALWTECNVPSQHPVASHVEQELERTQGQTPVQPDGGPDPKPQGDEPDLPNGPVTCEEPGKRIGSVEQGTSDSIVKIVAIVDGQRHSIVISSGRELRLCDAKELVSPIRLEIEILSDELTRLSLEPLVHAITLTNPKARGEYTIECLSNDDPWEKTVVFGKTSGTPLPQSPLFIRGKTRRSRFEESIPVPEWEGRYIGACYQRDDAHSDARMFEVSSGPESSTVGTLDITKLSYQVKKKRRRTNCRFDIRNGRRDPLTPHDEEWDLCGRPTTHWLEENADLRVDCVMKTIKVYDP